MDWEHGTAPHEAIGRAARRLSHGSSLYLGGGIGVERIRGAGGSEKYKLTGAKGTHEGPLSATVAAYAAAGKSTEPDSPGGTVSISNPAIAARVHQIDQDQAEITDDLKRHARMQAAEDQRRKANPVGFIGDTEDGWRKNRMIELTAKHGELSAERSKLLTTKVQEADADTVMCEVLAEMLLPDEDGSLSESAKTAALSVTHAPIGKGGSNYVTRSKPGNQGQYPAYIQNIRNALIRDGKTVAEASAIAIGQVKNWAAGKGNVSPEVRAAAAKAWAELKAIGAKSKAKTAGKLAESILTIETC